MWPVVPVVVLTAFTLTGCGTVYRAATEERPVSVMIDDTKITTKIKAKIVGDMDLRISQVDMVVVAGHVVLAGVVDRQEKIDRIVGHARSVEGVVAVKSFLQLKAQ